MHDWPRGQLRCSPGLFLAKVLLLATEVVNHLFLSSSHQACPGHFWSSGPGQVPKWWFWAPILDVHRAGSHRDWHRDIPGDCWQASGEVVARWRTGGRARGAWMLSLASFIFCLDGVFLCILMWSVFQIFTFWCSIDAIIYLFFVCLQESRSSGANLTLWKISPRRRGLPCRCGTRPVILPGRYKLLFLFRKRKSWTQRFPNF